MNGRGVTNGVETCLVMEGASVNRPQSANVSYEDDGAAYDPSTPDGRRMVQACEDYARQHGWDPRAVEDMVEPGDYATRSMIETAMSALSATDQDILEAVYIDGATLAEVADDMGCSYRAAQVRLFRARARLRQRYQRMARAVYAS